MITHEINGRVFGLLNDIIEVPLTNPKEFVIANTHYYIDGKEVSKDTMEIEYRKEVPII